MASELQHMLSRFRFEPEPSVDSLAAGDPSPQRSSMPAPGAPVYVAN